MDTKLVNMIKVNDETFVNIIDANIEEQLRIELDKFSDVIDSVNNLLKNQWVFIENKKIYYNNEIVALHPDLRNFNCGNCTTYYSFEKETLNLTFSEYTGDLMTLEEIKKCYAKESNLSFKDYTSYGLRIGKSDVWHLTYKINNSTYKWVNISSWSTSDFNCNSRYDSFHIPIYRLNSRNSSRLSNCKVLELWLKHRLIPSELAPKEKALYKNLMELYSYNPEYLKFNEKEMTINIKALLSDVNNGSFKEKINGMVFERSKMIEDAKKLGMLKATNVLSNYFYDKLLNCEKYRADIESYDERILTDPNRGHWDLWDDQTREELYTVQIDAGLMGRNPLVDIKDGGVIGIDFGTKSTVVVYQEDSDHTLPMRVGMGHYSKRIEAKHYENPTVMEFIDIGSFLEKYKSKEGRPDTLWEDLTVSHTAFNSLMASSSNDYYAYLSELKQWAGDKKRQVRLRDKQGRDIILPSYLDISEADLDPIELYAYFIGLHINNMHNSIYLDYILSFPVTYENAVREKIVKSFEKGLKKSLPAAILKNEDAMSRFRVAPGASEPAAYAICALQEYKFEPTGDEKIFYGVFDFGGGTTDFDFGIWREAGHSERRYDYVIEHFGAGGDQYLGGENLLELLAFEVFKMNQDKLRENGITFILPPECKRFAGSEILLSDSQEAKLNTKQLMEKLRPLWERHEGYEKDYNAGVIKVNLFNKSGQAKINFELSINKEELEAILHDRIEKGVRNFFDSLKLKFVFPETEGVKNVKIFLAGNSSKSQLLNDIFKKYINQETKSINEENGTEKEYFEIFPPLGTEEAYIKQRELGIEIDENVITRPTGKTGVAYGLLKSRKGGRIKVVDKNIVGNEIKFKYFVGYNRKGKLTVIINSETEYGKWYYFIDASEEDFELYYTKYPEASGNQLDIQESARKKCRISMTDDNANVYIRAVEPAVIEYVVADEDGIEKGKYLNSIIRIDLD